MCAVTVSCAGDDLEMSDTIEARTRLAVSRSTILFKSRHLTLGLLDNVDRDEYVDKAELVERGFVIGEGSRVM